MIRADLHVHTTYSSDSSINPKTLVEQLQAHPTIKAVAITDHGTIEAIGKVQKFASQYPDIMIIPGVEISTPEGDLVVLGTIRLPPKPWDAKGVTAFARKNECLIVAAHPYREYGLSDAARNYDLDAIETLNASSSSRANKLAEKLATEMKLPGIAGTDAHNIDELWTVYTEIQASMDIDGILDAIKNGFVKVAATGKSIHF